MNQAFLAKFASEPQFMEPVAHSAFVVSIMAARAAGKPDHPSMSWDDDDDELDTNRCYPVIDGVALIPVVGTLLHRDAYSYWGGRLPSYQAIADMIEDAVTDANVTAVLLDVDSPGGVAAGCLDFAEAIAKMRGIKPIWASINEFGCSAAYAIASACDKIVLGKSGRVGSIGVVATHFDVTAAMEKWGEKVTYLYKGAHKIDGAWGLALSDQARAAFMEGIEAQYQRFCEVVAANRGLTVEAVRKTEAAIYQGEDAVKAGLADEIMTQQEAIMALATKTAPTGARLNPASNPGSGEGEGDEEMTTKTSAEGAAEAAAQPVVEVAAAPVLAEAGAIAEACQAEGFPELTAALIKAKPTMEAVTARIAEAKEIRQAAVAVGMGAMAGNLIASGVNLETARKLIFDAKAGADGKLTTDTAHTEGHQPQAKTGQIDVQAAYARFNNVRL